MDLLDHLGGIRPGDDFAPGSDLDSWWSGQAGTREAFAPATFDVAVASACGADRLAYAFCSGYRAALTRLLPGLDGERVAALCVTEVGGNHPRAISTRLDTAADGSTLRLTGEKVWATGAGAVDLLLVAARRGERTDGRPDLALVRVDAASEGVTLEPMPAAPFVPEMRHCRVRFDSVVAAPADVLPGDGYADYVKPFRTIEDIHVMGALLGHVWGVGARFSWPTPVLDELLGLVVALRALAPVDPQRPAIHVALAGNLARISAVLETAEPYWKQAPAALAERWSRDRQLMNVAGRARQARRTKAWQLLGRVEDGTG